jgi:hypothetical protein
VKPQEIEHEDDENPHVLRPTPFCVYHKMQFLQEIVNLNKGVSYFVGWKAFGKIEKKQVVEHLEVIEVSKIEDTKYHQILFKDTVCFSYGNGITKPQKLYAICDESQVLAYFHPSTDEITPWNHDEPRAFNLRFAK